MCAVCSQRLANLFRNVVGCQESGADAVVDVVIDVRDDVGDADDVALEGQGPRFRPPAQQLAFLTFGMLQDSVAHLDGQIQILEHFDHADRLPVVIESAVHQLIQRGFAGMPERRMTEVVAQPDGFGEDFVEAKRFGDRTRDLRHL